MQKIMFNDRFLLTQAVLSGRKTQTRRIIKYPREVRGRDVGYYHYDRRNCNIELMDEDEFSFTPERYIIPTYDVGEMVAIAQRYEQVYADMIINFLGYNYRLPREDSAEKFKEKYEQTKGWKNKMFVKPELMPHHIRIINVRLQKLQDITDEECMLEGIREVEVSNNWGNSATHTEYIITYYNAKGLVKQLRARTPRETYALLIDKISGKGTWDSNPYVFAYDFELVR